MFIQHLSRAAQALAAPVVRLSRRSARFKVRLRAILLLCLSAAADTAIAVEAPVSFVTSFQVQSALEQYPGTRYFTVLLLHECPAGSVRSGPGCLTKKILYARKARGEAIPPDDILKPDPDLWKELKPHARFGVPMLCCRRIYAALAAVDSRRLPGSGHPVKTPL